MELSDFIRHIPRFDALSHPDRIILLVWYLHTHKKQERVTLAAVRGCYQTLNIDAPNLSRDLDRLVERRPAPLSKDRAGFYLAGKVRRELDTKHGEHESVITVSQLLKELPGKVAGQAEKHFLAEAIKCYRTEAFRAAIIMTWNLAYDHVLRWILGDVQRLAAFNAAIPVRFPRKTGIAITDRESFEELKESEVVEVCATAGLFYGNVKKILLDKLQRRNMAAHPSLVDITRAQADDTITDLVNNIVLKLV